MKSVYFGLVLFSTCSFLASAQADVVCGVTGVDPKNPDNYTRELLSVHLAAKTPAQDGTRYVIVDKNISKATEISREEFLRRRDQHDLKEYDGQTLVGFMADGETDSAIIVREIDSSREKSVKGGSVSYGNLEKRPLFVIVGDRQLAAGCLLK